MYQQMIDYFEAAIIGGQLKPGSRLPPMRKLCEQFSLSMGTVQRGIAVLEARALVESRQGSGIYVRPPFKARDIGAASISVIAESANPDLSYCAHALRGVQEKAEEHNCAFMIHFVRSYNFEEKLKLAMESDILLILGGYDDRPWPLKPNFPAVGLEIHRSFNGMMSTISIDPVRVAEMAVEYFQKRKIDHVHVFTQNIPCHLFRCDLFEAQWRAQGGRCTRFVEPAYGSLEMPQVLPGDGIFFSCGTYQQRLALHYFSLTGRHLREDYALLSVDGKSLLIPDYLPVSTIGTDWIEAGRVAMQECVRRLAFPGSPPRRLYLGVFPSYL